jgi:hypothetical protein
MGASSTVVQTEMILFMLTPLGGPQTTSLYRSSASQYISELFMIEALFLSLPAGGSFDYYQPELTLMDAENIMKASASR